MKPAALHNFGAFVGAIPIAGENIWPPNNNFIVVAELHFDPGDRRADVAWFDRHSRIIECAERGGFRQTVGLQHGNSQHQEKLLSFRGKRRGTADERTQVRAEATFHFCENEFSTKRQPERVQRFAAADVLALPGAARTSVESANWRGLSGDVVFDAALHTLEKSGHVQEIVWRGATDFIGEFCAGGCKREDAFV